MLLTVPRRTSLTDLLSALVLLMKQPGGLFVGGFLLGSGTVWRFVVNPLKATAEKAVDQYYQRIINDADYWKAIATKQANDE